MTAIIDNPKQLRSKIVVWAISTNVTDLIETMPPLGEYTYGISLNLLLAFFFSLSNFLRQAELVSASNVF